MLRSATGAAAGCPVQDAPTKWPQMQESLPDPNCSTAVHRYQVFALSLTYASANSVLSNQPQVSRAPSVREGPRATWWHLMPELLGESTRVGGLTAQTQPV